MTRPREEWSLDVGSRYKALEQFSKEDARLQFLRILRSLPYGNSIFFTVKRIEDPIGLLPAKLILGVNKRGVHFFRPVPKEYLHSAELRDIMQFGSSSTAVFFKMRVAGVLHIFQFETKQGEDICMALQTHINDIMMKRYSKVGKDYDVQRNVAVSNLCRFFLSGNVDALFFAFPRPRPWPRAMGRRGQVWALAAVRTPTSASPSPTLVPSTTSTCLPSRLHWRRPKLEWSRCRSPPMSSGEQRGH